MKTTIGCHVSSAGGYEAMGRKALELGADTFAFFTRNPRGGRVKAFDAEDAEKLVSLTTEHGFGPLVAHAPYTFNPAAQREDLREFAAEAMTEDLRRLSHIPGCFYNFHPGSHTGQGTETGIDKIAQLLNRILTPEGTTTVLLETMAGKGTEIGGSFEELRSILDRVEESHRVGVCLDTCHVWDAGYDIVDDFDGVLEEFDRVIGLDRLKAVHINDSKNERGARKDRHAKIGEGRIGFEALSAVFRHPTLSGLPFVLETPNDDAGYAEEIAMLRCGRKV